VEKVFRSIILLQVLKLYSFSWLHFLYNDAGFCKKMSATLDKSEQIF